MKQRPLSKLLSLTLVFELAFSPIALANPVTPPAGTTPAPSTNTQGKKHWTETFDGIMTGAAVIGNQMIQGMQMRQAQIAAENQMRALTSQMDPSNCGQGGQKVQCVSEIFPECNILNTRPNLVEPADCANGIDPADPAASAKAGAVMGYYNHYLQMENLYKNFNLETNNTSNTGIGCLNARADQLARTLKKREEEIDNLINKMQKAQDEFKKTAEQDRAKVEDAMALLEGEGFKGNKGRNGKGILEQNRVNFGDNFNDPACKAVMANNKFTDDGKKGGFKAIEASLMKIANDKKGGDGSFNALEFDASKVQSIQAKIQDVASQIAREVQLRGPESIEKSKGITPAFGLKDSKALQSVLSEESKKAVLDGEEIKRELKPYSKALPPDLLSALDDDQADFGAAVRNWERGYKNDCLTKHPNIQNLLSNKTRLVDRGASDAANEYSDNAYKTFIEATLNRTDIDIDQKLQMISAEEGRNGNSRYQVDTKKAAAVGDTTKKSSERMTASNFISLHVQNCNAQFDNNEVANNKSGKEIAGILRGVQQKNQAYRQQVAGKVQRAIVDRMVNCTDSTAANGAAVGSCTSEDLSTSSTNFCVKRANACATNMRSCFEKAKKVVADVTKKRDEAVAQYKANIQKNQDDLKKMYAMVEQITAVDGINIAASLKASLTLPTKDLQFHIDSDKRNFVPGLESLEMQDPDQYFNLMKKNLVSLKAQVQDQNKRVLGGDPDAGGSSVAQKGVYGHIQNIQQNMSNIMGDIQNFKQMCQGAFQAFVQGQRQQRAEQMKAQQEAQKKQAEFCGRHNEISSMPGCENADEFDDIINAAREAGAGNSKEAAEARAWKNFCKSRGDSNTDQMDASTFFIRRGKSVIDACKEITQSPPASCATLITYQNKCGDDSQDKPRFSTTEVEAKTGYADCFVKEGDRYVPKTTSTGLVADKITICNQMKSEIGCKDNHLEEYTKLSSAAARAANARLASSDTRNDGQDFNARYSNLGENRSSMCTAQDNSGLGAVGKAASTVMQTWVDMQNVGAHGQ